MNESLLFGRKKNYQTFPVILIEVQEYMSKQYAMLISNNPEEQKEQIKAYIAKYLIDTGLTVEFMAGEELIDKLYEEMAEYSFLTQYLKRNDVEEINVNSWKDIKITYTSGEIIPTKERFSSPDHALDVIRRLLHSSGMILDNSQPTVCGHLDSHTRVTAYGRGVIDDDIGVVASIRIVNPQKLTKEQFVANGTATLKMLSVMSALLRYGISMCVAGATSSGKTTLMSWILSSMPDHLRIFTVENGVREFNLVKESEDGTVLNNVIHTITRHSDDPTKNIDTEMLLEKGLTTNPDIIAIAETKGPESQSAQEAARTGHAVITTVHANSCRATYHRLMTLSKMKYNIDDATLFTLVTEAFPIVMFCKRLEDNSRKVMEIMECQIHDDGTREMITLYRFHTEGNEYINGKMKIRGEYEQVNCISESLQKRLIESGMPMDLVEELK